MMRLPTVLSLVLMSGTPAISQSAEVVRSSIESGSERLSLYSTSKFVEGQPDADVLRVLDQIMRNQAFRLDGSTPPAEVISTTIAVSPILAYDDNINGGNRNNSFTLGEFLTFTVAEDAVAKEGVVLGAGLETGLRYGYGRGRYLDARSSVSGVYSPEHELFKYSTFVELCSRNHLFGWTFVDGCATTQSLDVDLGKSREEAVRLSATQLFTAGGFDHELTGSVGRNWISDFEQDNFQTRLTTSIGELGSVAVAVELGEEDGTNHVQRERLSLGYNTRIADRRFAFSYSRAQSRGSMFLGDVREDVTSAYGVSTRINDRFSINARYTNNDSTVDFFSYSSIGVGVGITGFSF